MLSRRSFFGMLGGAAVAVPVSELRPAGAEGSVLEIRRESKYILVLEFPRPLRREVHQRLGNELERTLRERGLDNVTALILDSEVTALILDSEAEFELYRLDPPA